MGVGEVDPAALTSYSCWPSFGSGGGTVYQAFLSATNYHRGHSPVAGTVVRAFVQEGAYYSEADSEGPDAAEPQESQGYLAHVAARAIILIQADDPVIGLVAFVAVGMSEVSSCLINPDVVAGYHLAKGEELGYFQFGGSTHCLVFRPGVIADFSLGALPRPHDPDAPLVLVGSRLATAPATTWRSGTPSRYVARPRPQRGAARQTARSRPRDAAVLRRVSAARARPTRAAPRRLRTRRATTA